MHVSKNIEKNLNCLTNEKITHTEELIYKGDYKKAHQFIETISKGNRSRNENLRLRILKEQIMNGQGKYQKALISAKKTLRECQNLKAVSCEMDTIIEIVEALWGLRRFDELLEMIESGEKCLKRLEGNEAFVRECSILHYRGKYYHSKNKTDLSLEYIKRSLILCEKHNNRDGVAWNLFFLGIVHHETGNSRLALEYFQQSLDYFKELGCKKGIAEALYNLGWAYGDEGKYKLAIDYLQQCLALRKKLGNKIKLAWVFIGLGKVYGENGELKQAMEHLQQSNRILGELNNKQGVAWSLIYTAIFHHRKGELNKSLDCYQKVLPIYTELGYKIFIAHCLYGIGMNYYGQSELDQALKYLQEGLAIFKEVGNKRNIVTSCLRLISIALDKNSPEQAQHYLKNLKQLSDKETDKGINQGYRIAEALKLINSNKISNKIQARDLLRQIVEEEIVHYEISVMAVLNLLKTLLAELRLREDPKVLEEMHQLFERLLEIAEDEHLYLLVTETYRLQALLALIKLDSKKAQDWLERAQVMVKKGGFQSLITKMSKDQNKIDNWEKNTEKLPFSERIQATGLEESIKNLKRRFKD